LGHLIRRGTYQTLADSPFKISLEWLTDEIFHRYMSQATFKSLSVDWRCISSSCINKQRLVDLVTTQPTQFNRVRSTGLPTFNQLFPEQNKPQN